MSMDRERSPATPPPLRPVEFHILLSLADSERHGYAILRDIERRGETADVGTLYRALARLSDQGLIAPAGRDMGTGGGDERRNSFRLTPRGVRAAQGEARRLAALAREAMRYGLLAEAAP